MARWTSWAPWEYPERVSSVEGHSERVLLIRAALGSVSSLEIHLRKGCTLSLRRLANLPPRSRRYQLGSRHLEWQACQCHSYTRRGQRRMVGLLEFQRCLSIMSIKASIPELQPGPQPQPFSVFVQSNMRTITKPKEKRQKNIPGSTVPLANNTVIAAQSLPFFNTSF